MLISLGINKIKANGGIDNTMKKANAPTFSLLVISLKSEYRINAKRRLLNGRRNTYAFRLKPVTIVIDARRTSKTGKGS
jgi:hypothetical protein